MIERIIALETSFSWINGTERRNMQFKLLIRILRLSRLFVYIVRIFNQNSLMFILKHLYKPKPIHFEKKIISPRCIIIFIIQNLLQFRITYHVAVGHRALLSLRGSSSKVFFSRNKSTVEEPKNMDETNEFMDEFLGHRIGINAPQRLVLGVGSSLAALLNPHR